MVDPGLTARDREELAQRRIGPEEIERQLDLFRRPPPPARLVRPCTPGDGIRVLRPAERSQFESQWQECADRGRLIKFVPASGAATRMFKGLRKALEAISSQSGSNTKGQAQAKSIGRFVEGLPRFAFQPRLDDSLKEMGSSLEEAISTRNWEILLRRLLERPGLDLDSLPKALIEFHRYGANSRTAFEEHLVEGAGYLSGPNDPSHHHFTVSPEHRPPLQALVSSLGPSLEDRLGRPVDIGFSLQTPATDTLAVNPDDSPFRLDDGHLLFRPSGHGALLSNLAGLGGDIVIVKNIDNIAVESRHALTASWKRSLIGLLASMQERIFALLEEIDSATFPRHRLDEVLAWIHTELAIELPEELRSADDATLQRYLVDRLDRPLRVCGMVRNEGEPGGGPFWVAGRDDTVSGQIVERAQVDSNDAEQEAVWSASTHFNPVDLVCGLRDRHGVSYPLERYVDPATSFISSKSHQGRPLKALERPGLWNGAMAGWNTIFVEVPLETFTPVKTVFDLLLPAHQAHQRA